MAALAGSSVPEPGAARWREINPGWLYVMPALVITLTLFIAPLAVMLVMSLHQRVAGRITTTFSPQNYLSFFERDYLRAALVNSLEVALIVTAVATLLAYPFAYAIVTRIPRRWQRLALITAILPFWTSYLVRSYSWLLVLSPTGIVPDALGWLGLDPQAYRLVANRTGTVIGFVHFAFMLETLTIFASLVRIPANLARAAADLGAGPVTVFARITLPLSMPGVLTGAFLTFVLTIGDYVTPQILGGSRELLMPQAIMLQIGRLADFPMASAMAMILMTVIVAISILFGRRAGRRLR